MPINFYFDTANPIKIEEWWKKLKNIINPANIIGVTTNPNALNKVEVTCLNVYIEVIYELFEILKIIKKNNDGIVYIQIPNSQCSLLEIEKFVGLIKSIFPKQFKIGLKIPPRIDILKFFQMPGKSSEFRDLYLNVTGITDSLTALQMLSYDIKYISFLTGRLEESGVDAGSHISFVNNSKLGNKKIIAGSMRTPAQLELVCGLNCVPTIGETLWNSLFEENKIDLLTKEYKTQEIENKDFSFLFSPYAGCNKVAKDFLNQMDTAGRNMHEVFKAIA